MNRSHRFVARRLVNLTVLVLTLAVIAPVRAAAPNYDWPQFNESDWSGTHSGVNSKESSISVSTVASLVQKFRVSLPSVADGAPAYLTGVSTSGGTRDLLFFTTKDGRVLALDGHTGATVWSTQYGPGTCVSSNGGVCYTTSSPVIDPNRQYVYSYGLDGRVHKLRVGAGTEVTGSGWPELATLKPATEKGSSVLSVATTSTGTYLYVTSAGYPGDAGDYQGHVTTIDLATGNQTVFNTLCSNQTVHFTTGSAPDCPQTQGAVWARPGVVYDADTSRVYFSTGNATFNPGSFDWGDSVLALNPNGSGRSTTPGYPVDSYTPTNAADLNARDADLGSTAPAILPSSAIPTASVYKHLAVQSGKDGYVRLLNLDDLSGAGRAGSTGGEIFSVPLPIQTEVLSQPAVWVNGADGTIWIFVVNNGGLSALTLTVDARGRPALRTAWSNSMNYRDSLGSSPLVSNGVLFDARNNLIEALDPLTGRRLWSDSGVGGIHWESPIVANGMLYIADENSTVTAYSVPSSPPATSTIGSTSVGTNRIGSEANYMVGSRVTIGAQPETVQSISAYLGAIDSAPNNQYSVAVYSDYNGSPFILVAQSGNGTLRPNSWNTLPISAQLQANGSYWLVYNTNGSSNSLYYNTVSNPIGAFSTFGQPFGNWPFFFSWPWTGNWQVSVYATVTP